MTLIAIDTNIVIWGIKKQATQGQEGLISQAHAFLERLADEKVGVVIPTIVVGEVLIQVPQAEHNEFIRNLQRHFRIADFDAKAAAVFARISQSKKGISVPGKSREELKVDRMIVATAIARNAACIYSHDLGIHKYAEDFIEARYMPEIGVQLNLL